MPNLVERAYSKFREEGLQRLLISSFSFGKSEFIRYISLLKAKLRSGKHMYQDIWINIEPLDPVIQRNITNKEYENGAIENIDEYIEPNYDVIELGGGIGIVSCYINKVTKSDTTQVVLEPDHRVIGELKNNVSNNDADIEIINAAYSPDNTPVTLTFSGPFWESSTIKDGNEEVTVDGVSLDNVLSEFDVSDFALITNSEGAEYPLIYNEMELLRKQCHTMIIGFHDMDGYSMEDTIAHIENNGYECVQARGNKKYVFKRVQK